MEGLDKDRQLQTGEIIIIVAVLLMWAGECHKQHSSRLGQRCSPGYTKDGSVEAYWYGSVVLSSKSVESL